MQQMMIELPTTIDQGALIVPLSTYSSLKHRLKPSQSPEKETTKVG
jgi:hypothetical protein